MIAIMAVVTNLFMTSCVFRSLFVIIQALMKICISVGVNSLGTIRLSLVRMMKTVFGLMLLIRCCSEL